MEINKLIKHMQILALQQRDLTEFRKLYAFHWKLVEMRQLGITHFT